MARLIIKFKYLKPNAKQGVGGYVKYIATREGMDKIDESFKLAPTSVKQQQLIKKILRDFPDSKDMHEYEDYVAEPNMGNASEFISRALEDNAQSVVGRKTYADYIATRPRAERFGSHGLFTDDGIEIKLDKVSEELNKHKGNVWTVILSLRREDAQRLGYDSGKRWRDMLRSHAQSLAENLKIPMENLRWYAAFHNEGHHPHVHLIAYSVFENEGYLTEKGVHNLRSEYAREIFAQDLLSVYEKQTEYRDELRNQGRDKIEEIIRQINSETYENLVVEEKLKRLAERLSKTKGKKQYGYLKSDVKAIVNSIVDEIAKDERIEKLYELWYEQREEVIKTYTQELPGRLPLSQNNEFKSIRNAVIQEAMNLLTDQDPIDEPEDTKLSELEPTYEEAEKQVRRNRKTMWGLYQWAKSLLDKDSADYNPDRAVELLKESAKHGNTVAKFRLGKMLLDGDEVGRDITAAIKWLEEAVEGDNEYAQYLLGKTLLKDEEVGHDYKWAKELLELASGKGNKYAEYILGKALLGGEGLEQDISEAIKLLKSAADKGYLPAEYVYGKLLYKGEIIPKNTEKSLEYLERAAGRKSSDASYLAGKIRLTEENVKDVEKAIKHFKDAADNGNDYAEYQLGKIYLYGRDAPRNEELATQYLTASAEHGNEKANELLVRIRESKDRFHARVVSDGVLRLFKSIIRTMQDKFEENYSKKPMLTDKKLWQRIEEKRQAQGLKHG